MTDASFEELNLVVDRRTKLWRILRFIKAPHAFLRAVGSKISIAQCWIEQRHAHDLGMGELPMYNKARVPANDIVRLQPEGLACGKHGTDATSRFGELGLDVHDHAS